MTQTETQSCYIIGDIGTNHNGDPQLAHYLVDIAARNGCDAVLIPWYNATSTEKPMSVLANVPIYTPSEQVPRLPVEALSEIREICQGRLHFIGAPYDLNSLEDLRKLEPDGIQIDPPLLGHKPLLEALAKHDWPVFLSVGMCSEEDIVFALKILNKHKVTLLHTVHALKTTVRSTALGLIPYLQQRFDIPIGYRGTESGITASIAAFALGARTIEKPFTSDHHLSGQNHAASLDREELRELVSTLREMEEAIQIESHRVLLPVEVQDGASPRASLVAARDLTEGTILDDSMLTVELASDGISPRLIDNVLGRRLLYDVTTHTSITFGALGQ